MSWPQEAVGARSRVRERGNDERGVMTTELAIMFPVLLAMVVVIVIAGRVALQDASVRSAADAAARSASRHTTSSGAQGAATDAASRNTGSCASVAAAVLDWVDPTPATPGYVTVRVTCTQALVGLSGSTNRTVQADARSVLEYWRTGP